MPTTVTGTETTISGLTAGTQYRFRVRARNAVGYGPYSAWSEPGTPTGVGGGGGGRSLKLNVTISGIAYASVGDARYGTISYGVGTATASATLAGGSGILGSLTYNWEGRYLRQMWEYQVWPAGNGPVFVVYDPEDPWASVNAYKTTSSYRDWTKAYVVGPSLGLAAGQIHFRKSFASPNQLTFPDHFWELRCRVTGTALVDGSSVSLEGISRTVAFKEMWNGVDYPTTIGGGIL